MTRTRSTFALITALATLPLAAVACGTATTDQPTGHEAAPSSGTPREPGTPGESGATPRSFAAGLLARSRVPERAEVAAHAPSKALERLPAMAGLGQTPVVVKRFWSVPQPEGQVVDWLRAHVPDGLRFDGAGSSGDTGGGSTTARYLAFRSTSLPHTIALGDLYLAVISTGPHSSAIGAYAMSLPQPPRPAAEDVPVDLSSAVIGWSLAPGGTPVRKVLTGAAAQQLARDFNTLRVDAAPMSPCPLIPQQGGDIVVTFRADGHTWKIDVPACPDITVRRDGVELPALSFGPAFLDNLRKYVGHLPQAGPPRDGGVIPLVQPIGPIQPAQPHSAVRR